MQNLIGTMVDLKYLKGEEIPSIQARTSPLQVAAYAPLGEATLEG